MTKYLIVGDVHFSTYSSIIRDRGIKYSTRLENIIKSINWVEELAQEKNVDYIVYLGDFFDKDTLTSEELTALSSIKWNKDISHILLVGNHESNVVDLRFSSANYFSNNFTIIDKEKLEIKQDKENKYNVAYIPYKSELTRKSFVEYLDKKDNTLPTIVFSHNDIKGINYGAYKSEIGFDIEEIENNCDLFVNGHLHNQSLLNNNKNYINLGNLTGQNFSEDAFKYNHSVMLLTIDNNKLDYELVNNQVAFNFYKFDIVDDETLNYFNNYNFKDNSILTIKCLDSLVDKLKINDKITHYRLITTYNKEKVETETFVDLGVNHIETFRNFMYNTLKDSYDNKTIKSVLERVCK